MEDISATARNYMRAWELSDPVFLARTETGHLQRVTCRDGRFAVLKCLTEAGCRYEGSAARVLRALGGAGAVQVLRADDSAQLLEFCDGPKLLDFENGHRDAVALPILADVVRRLRSKGKFRPAGVPSLADRCRAIDRALSMTRGKDASLLDAARKLADIHLVNQRPTLLHGDLHHENIMRCSRPDGETWLAIDPQGLWGDPAYEVANFFGNPRDFPEITLAKDRPMQVALSLEKLLGLPAKTTLAWAFVHSCISAVWSLEDGQDPTYRLRVAGLIEQAL